MFSSRSRRSQQNSMDEIDIRLKLNQNQLLNMQNFIELKQTEITELQRYLVEQFKNMEVWKQKQDKIKDILGVGVKQILTDVKKLIGGIVQDYKRILQTIIKQSLQTTVRKLYQKNQQIQQKNKQINLYLMEIQKLKFQTMSLSRANPNLNSPMNINSMRNLDDSKIISRQVSQKRLLGNKSMSKSTFLDYSVLKTKDKEKQQTSKSRSPNNEERNSRILKNYKNLYQEENKSLSKSSTTKKIVYEIRKQLKDDYQNQKGPVDHKKYVKQKIQCLKNKSSGVNYDIKAQKTFKRF